MKTWHRMSLFAALAAFALFAGSVSAKTTSYHLDEVYKLAPDGTIYLTTNDADVLIAGSDRDDVHVVVDYARDVSGLGVKSSEEPFEMDVTEEKGNLHIRERGGSTSYVGLMVSIHEEYSVTIEAPKNARLQIKGDDDTYMINSFTAPVRLRMEDGRARLRDMSGDQFEFEMDDGHIELEGGTGLLDVYTEDGSFYCENGAFQTIRAETEDGELEIATTLNDKGDYHLRGEDGDVTLTVLGGGGEISVDYDDGGARATGDFNQVDKDDGYRLFKLPGGDARVRIRVEDGRVSLRTR